MYQAALEAGSGGIRYNDSTKTIQLMDVNKNWIDWKLYDAYSEFNFLTEVVSTNGTFNYTYPKTGLYLWAIGGYQIVISSFSTGGTQKNLINEYINNGNSCRGLIAVYASNGDTANMNVSIGTTYNAGFALFYLGSQYENTNLLAYESLSNGQTRTLSFDNVSNRVLIAYSGSGGGSRYCSLTSSVREQASNGKSYACVSTAREVGSATISAFGPSNQGTTGFIADVQLN